MLADLEHQFLPRGCVTAKAAPVPDWVTSTQRGVACAWHGVMTDLLVCGHRK
jgi:hypothetical protein